jgi:hypothetical protein
MEPHAEERRPLPGDRGESPALSGCHRVSAGGCGEYAEKFPGWAQGPVMRRLISRRRTTASLRAATEGTKDPGDERPNSTGGSADNDGAAHVKAPVGSLTVSHLASPS